MAKSCQDRELEQYRQLMQPPETFADGFNWKTVIGAIFIGFIMMPGSMYLSLIVGSGGSIASASQWVTIILFAEVARRSFKDLKMQEVYILYYMAGLALSSPFQGLLWNQYFIQSDYAQAMGVAQEIPAWVSPSADAIREAGRTFFTRGWLAPIGFISLALVIGQIDNFGLGYVLYRITSDVEELPFPMAPVGAAGIIALTESSDSKERWRWRCFSIGGMLGMIYGAFYIALPAVTGSFMPSPIMLIPIPFIDFTPAVSEFLKATPLNLTIDLGLILTGMVLPFWAIIGGGVGMVTIMALNPILYRNGILSNWQPGMDVIDTVFVNSVDFYLSFGIGLTIAITLVALGQIMKPLFNVLRPYRGARDVSGKAQEPRRPSAWRRLVVNNTRRGDFSIFIALGIYVFSSTFWIGLSTWLIPEFPWKFFVIYAVVYTPLISYACAKLEGMAGQALSLPMVREATYILSGYRGIQIWYAPAPLPNYGPATVGFRIMDLTGTKIISKVKTQMITIPVIVVASLIFSQLLWKMAEVPSDAYPFAQKMWDLQAKTACLTMSSTMEGGSLFFEALKFKWFAWGLGMGVGLFVIMSSLGMPTLLVYGVVRGLGQTTPAGIPLEVLGALIGRFYFRKKFGDRWLKYTPVMLAGYACGMGLVAMVGMAFAILNKMMTPLIF
ncbi:MAG: OPT/YSL family transporter [Verrucomicrobia bacterium]|nr:OPT/YSL family transporter [Verrucomicrobiota bacterium]MCG2679840.1 OPT/YSL family transporter [Kiritimatiellia bacterium]MBU4248488.1 OPT/YSL family transporter [Verrucomicrobiota bacterium]MBU4290375.1 OPT/YSL family transporter [Verrucomicrobiota bacterium]MBU4429763.1 OPT/YSL family transporter [Verrucomicrobiota bacterium]